MFVIGVSETYLIHVFWIWVMGGGRFSVLGVRLGGLFVGLINALRGGVGVVVGESWPPFVSPYDSSTSTSLQPSNF